MLGLRKRPSYDEVIDYLETEQPKIKYPDRRATFLRNSPYLSQFDGDSWMNLDEQDNRMRMQQMRELEMRRVAAATKKTFSTFKAQAGAKPFKTEVFKMAADDDIDSDFENTGETINQEEQKHRKSKTKQPTQPQTI